MRRKTTALRETLDRAIADRARAIAAVSKAMVSHHAGQRVLVVDDDADGAALLAAALHRDLDVDVVVAGTGAEAIRLATHEQFRLAVVDYHLPDMDAPELLNSLTSAGCKPIGVIAISGSRDAVEIVRECGVSAAFAKPFPLDALLNAARRLLPA